MGDLDSFEREPQGLDVGRPRDRTRPWPERGAAGSKARGLETERGSLQGQHLKQALADLA